MVFKRKKARTRARFFGKARRIGRKLSPSSSSLVQIDAMIYGAMREKVNSMILPYSSKLPFGANLVDNLGMGILTYFVAKKTGGIIRNVAIKGLVVENALIGADLGGSIFGSTAAQTSNSTGDSW